MHTLLSCAQFRVVEGQSPPERENLATNGGSAARATLS